MKENNLRLILFYSCASLKTDDVENSLFTREREEFKFFLFNNKNLHFSKDEIKKQSLSERFHQVEPKFVFNDDSVKMVKEIVGFDEKEFKEKVETNYKDYLKKINYRINCIFQSFSIFYDIYTDKSIIFVIPEEIKVPFLEYTKKNNFFVKLVKKDSKYMVKYDIFHWLKYYSREDSNHLDMCALQENDITTIATVSKG